MGLDAIDRRLRLFNRIYSFVHRSDWSNSDTSASEELQHTMLGAIHRCIEDLPEVVKKLKKTKKKKILDERWKEPSTTIMEYLKTQSQPANTAALHFSNLQAMPLEQLGQDTHRPRYLNIDTTRDIYKRVYNGDGDDAVNTLIHWCSGDQTLVLWAPDSPEQLNRLMAAIKRAWQQVNVACRVQLLVPYVPIPGCSEAEQILDLWSHPIMNDKFKDQRSEICFLSETSRCIFLREGSPIYILSLIHI